jgi:hypothetical protein
VFQHNGFEDVPVRVVLATVRALIAALLLLATTASAGSPHLEGGGGAIGFSTNEWLQIAANEHPRFHYVHKFGENPSVQSTSESIWDCPHLDTSTGNVSYVASRNGTFGAGATNLWVSSEDAGETTDITVYGLSSTNDLQQATVTLSGRTFVPLTGATLTRPEWSGTASDTWNHVYRATTETQNDGNIWIHKDDVDADGDGKPDFAFGLGTAACISAGRAQTQMAVFQVPGGMRAHYMAHELGITGTASADGVVSLFAGVPTPGAIYLKQIFSNGVSSNRGIDHSQPFSRVFPEQTLFEIKHDPLLAATQSVYATFDLLLERQ